jgi:ATP-binding cassette, subfamily B, bacterial PglK
VPSNAVSPAAASFDTLRGLLIRLGRHLGPRRQRQFVLLLGLMFLSTLAEVISLGAVLPFLAILTAPDKAFRNPIIARAAHALQLTTPDQLVLPLTIAFAAAALVSGAIRIAQLGATMRFTFAAGADISNDIYRRTLYQPYQVHITRGSEEVISGIIHKAGSVVLGILLPLMTLISSVLLLVALLGALVAIDPLVAGVAVAGFGGGYAAITVLTRRRLRVNSQRVANEYTRVIKALQEGLGGIRDVLLDGTQPMFCDVYRKADRAFRRAQGENTFIGQSPRFAMEALGMILIAGLAFGLSHRAGGVAAALPILGALAIGAQRLMPALQQAFAAWATMMGSHASLADTVALLDQPVAAQLLEPQQPALRLRDAVRFNSVRFRYSADGPWVLDGLELNIAKGARVGVVGSTGSGKSTLLDLLMGLLLPTEGELVVDGEALSGGRIRSWQRSIAHVPQSIYLADTSIAENIAFGVPSAEIDMERVRKAAREAQIADFIESTAQGYEAHVGERGVRISGGQRQRVGIARALYKRACVLVLDEATSALDTATERSVMDAIDGLDRDLTVVIIAHRLSTVRRCDTIVELKQGRIVAQGKYEQLLETSPSFRHMVHATHTA